MPALIASTVTPLLISDALGIPVAAIEHEHLWAFAMGWLDEGSSCALWLRDYRPAAPGLSAIGPYTLAVCPTIRLGDGMALRAAGESFDAMEWPGCPLGRERCTSLAEGMDGE